jgi:hypothetical protein
MTPALNAARSDHPRVRGEHWRYQRPCLTMCGPSPRARGTRAPTPRSTRYRMDHPRVRGEHAMRGSGISMIAGPSPRARGTHATGGRCVVSQIGPSPRARGTRLADSQAPQWFRTIPACAGNTLIYLCGWRSLGRFFVTMMSMDVDIITLGPPATPTSTTGQGQTGIDGMPSWPWNEEQCGVTPGWVLDSVAFTTPESVMPFRAGTEGQNVAWCSLAIASSDSAVAYPGAPGLAKAAGSKATFCSGKRSPL